MQEDERWLKLILRLGTLCRNSAGQLDLQAFTEDEDLVDATSFRLQHIGEAVSRLSPELRARHPDARWPGMVHMRNILAHAYEQVAPDIIWTVVRNDLEPLLALCERELATGT